MIKIFQYFCPKIRSHFLIIGNITVIVILNAKNTLKVEKSGFIKKKLDFHRVNKNKYFKIIYFNYLKLVMIKNENTVYILKLFFHKKILQKFIPNLTSFWGNNSKNSLHKCKYYGVDQSHIGFDFL